MRTPWSNVLAAVLIAAASCSPSEPRPPAAPALTSASPVQESQRCIADGLGELVNVETYDSSCLHGESCKDRCARGERDACLARAYTLQNAESYREADEVFARACQLGSAIGCTNFAAALWIRDDERPDAAACARQLFERACEVREPFGCGMMGRMMATAATTDDERVAARRHFDRVCSELGGMSCRMYAFHLELEQLGSYDPALIRGLLLRACDTGDDDACGHETAGETFSERRP